jgi:hypothetical protein
MAASHVVFQGLTREPVVDRELKTSRVGEVERLAERMVEVEVEKIARREKRAEEVQVQQSGRPQLAPLARSGYVLALPPFFLSDWGVSPLAPERSELLATESGLALC